jgi:hypothetical protein
MSKHLLAAAAAALFALNITAAEAQRVRGARENAAGGVTAGGAHDVRGPLGGRAVGEGGVVTDGDGNGVAGSRGCARTGAGGYGCGAGATSWDEDGAVQHQQSGYVRGRWGGEASTEGSFSRDEDGDWSGQRNSEAEIGDRTYSVDTTFDSDDGWDRDVDCSGSACPD